VARHPFSTWKYNDYDRAYGDWRDEDEVVTTNTPTNGYRGQIKSNEVVFAFEAVETELPDLPLVAAPEASEVAPQVASCACGLLVPLEAVFSHRAGRKGGTPHFQKEGEHRETTNSEEHHQIVFDTLMEAVMNGQEAMKRWTIGEESVVEGTAKRRARAAEMA
jgi:hypothetical protein